MNPQADVIGAMQAEANREIARLSRLIELLPAIDPEIAAKSVDTFGSAVAAATWLLSNSIQSIPESPFECSMTPDGKTRVMAVLNAIDHGISLS